MDKNRRPMGNRPQEDKEFDQRMIDIARVTRVMAGGKRMRFRACVAIGDRKGRCGIGIAKGADVTLAVNKAVTKAKKNMITVPMKNETILHQVRLKHGAAQLLLKPAPQGTGIKAGGAIRVVLELAGVPNISAKILGTGNKINNVQTLIMALGMFKPSAITSSEKKTAPREKSADAPAVTPAVVDKKDTKKSIAKPKAASNA